ncbi:MAG: GntR family transcriptional regulator [Actinomycetota bacterium]
MTAALPSRSLREDAADALRRGIVTGDLVPGQKLREVALSQDLGISRPTLREALQRLVNEGLLVHEHNRGFSVATLDDDAIRDLATTRVLLDRAAVQGIWADPARLDEVSAAWDEYTAHDVSDPLDRHDAHLRLHQSLWEASHNAVLVRLWPVTEALSTLALAQDQALRQDPQRALDVHGELIDAVLSQDPERLEQALQRHTHQSAEEFLTLRTS